METPNSIIKNSQTERMILEVLNNFNFNLVQNYMRSTNWRWGDDKTPPTLTELKDTAKYLLREVAYKEVYTSMTGGLMAVAYGKDSIMDFTLELYFVPTWATCTYRNLD